ncbi:MAG: peptide ABC transporter substrate-binding protein [Mycobacterium sp.]
MNEFPENLRHQPQTGSMTRRDFVVRMALLTVVPAALLAACTRTAPPAPTVLPAKPTVPSPPSVVPNPSVVPSPSPAAAGRASGGTLHLLWWQAPTILNSHLSSGQKDIDAARPVLEPLATAGPDGKPVAVLAVEVPTQANGGVSKDLKTVTWKLKQGIKWSDGTDFTADDVVFTYQYMADKATAATDAQAAQGVQTVEAKDPHTVVVTWTAPNPNPYQLFVSYFGLILQKKQFQNYMGAKAKDAPGNQQPLGTGPYKVTQFKPGDVVIYAINDQYREPAKPFFKEVQLKGGGDATSAARAVFQTGDADYAWNLQVESSVLKQLMQGGKGDLIIATGPNVERILLNRANPNETTNGARAEPVTKHPFFSDLNVRKAFAMAVDRKTIAQQLYGDTGVASTNMVTAPADFASPNTAKLDVAQFDLAKANQLLDQAGWLKGADGMRAKNGTQMKVVFQTSVNDLRQKEQEIVKQSWQQLGVAVELKTVQASVFFGSDAGNPDTDAHFYADVEMFTNGSEQPDQTNYLSNWTTQQIAQQSNQWRSNNYERFSNPEYDQSWQQLKAETDPVKRKDLVIKLNDLLVSDVVDIPLVARNSPVSGKSKQLQGIQPNPWESELWNVSDWTRTGG